jgi:hypothetical protein
MVLADGERIDQWNRMENPEIDPQKHSRLVFNKGDKFNGERVAFYKWDWNDWTSLDKKKTTITIKEH